MTEHHATHIVIPDTQVKQGVPLDHLGWIGQYVVDKFAGQPNVKLIHLGDHWDMPSLSSYDKKGGTKLEGLRIVDDIEVGNEGMRLLDAPLHKYNKWRKVENRWYPESRTLLRGNHEYRVNRYEQDDAQKSGLVPAFLSPGWETHEFLEPVFIDGVGYAHYWYNPMTGTPYGGMIETRLKNVGHSFTMGHQQTLLYGIRYVGSISQHGLVAGSCYLHDEDYKGPQGNTHWRGIIVKHEVRHGSYDPMFVSLDYLCRRYEGCSLARFMQGRIIHES